MFDREEFKNVSIDFLFKMSTNNNDFDKDSLIFVSKDTIFEFNFITLENKVIYKLQNKFHVEP